MAKKISSLSVVLGATVKPFVSAFGTVGNSLKSFTSGIASAGSQLAKLTGVGAIVGGAFAALKGAASGITLAADLEQTGVALEVMLGSAERAKRLMGELTGFAAETPFEFPEIADSAKKLLAFGVNSDKVLPSLKAIGDIAAGVRAPVSELAEIYGKAKTQGTLFAEDINQLTGRGIPIIQELAKQFGVAESQVKKLTSEGKVNFGHLEKAFQDLTGEGGKFTGLMAKQSQTLGGMWSTLTDNIGMTMAGLVTTIVDAFSLRDALKSFTAGVGSFGTVVTSVVSAVAPVVRSFAAGIYNTVAPAVAAVTRFFADNWQQMLTGAVSFGMSIRSFLASMWNGIAAMWSWGTAAITGSSQSAGSTVHAVFSGMVAVGAWLRDTVGTAFQFMTYTVTHWRDALDLAVTGAAYTLVKFGNEVEHLFTGVIPAVLDWFADDWQNILTDVFNWTGTVFANLAENVVSIVTSIPDLISGAASFEDVWKPLTEGFERASKALVIPDRQIGELERGLGDEVARLSSQYSKGFADSVAGHQRAAEAAAKSISDGIAGVFKVPEVAVPALPEVTLPVGVDPKTLDVQVKPKLGKAVMVGSAEAAAARFTPAPMKSRDMREAAAANESQKKMAAEALKQTALLTRIAASVAGGAIIQQAEI